MTSLVAIYILKMYMKGPKKGLYMILGIIFLWSWSNYKEEWLSLTSHLEECKGVLELVVKLDKCEIVKEKKIERVTITMMNWALDPYNSK